MNSNQKFFGLMEIGKLHMNIGIRQTSLHGGCFFFNFFINHISYILFYLIRLYNESPVRETIVTNDRWGQGTLCKHGDFITCSDRYNPGVLQKRKWENALTIDKYSWGYRADARLEDFLTSEELIEGAFYLLALFFIYITLIKILNNFRNCDYHCDWW